MRYQDPEGDYGRQKRQREVIQKVVEKVLSLNSVSHYQSILKALSTNMQTNIDLSASNIHLDNLSSLLLSQAYEDCPSWVPF